jgi:hypothetical protein
MSGHVARGCMSHRLLARFAQRRIVRFDAQKDATRARFSTRMFRQTLAATPANYFQPEDLPLQCSHPRAVVLERRAA